MTNTIKEIADRNGLPVVMDILQEECAELIQAISKLRRNPSSSTYVSLAEEVADVEIMIEQIKHLMDSETMVEMWQKVKVKRQLEREAMNHE